MEKKEKFNPDFNKDIARSDWFWNYMEDYWHKNREFPESVENHLNRKADLVNGKVPSSQLPSYVDDVLEFNAFENLPVSGEKGKIYLVTNNNTQFRWSGSTYIQIASGAVQSVNGQTGVVNLIKSDIGLPNVDNTADIVKNVATAGNLRVTNITLTQLNSFDLESGIYKIENQDLGIGTGSFHHIIQTGKYSGGGHVSQIAIPFDGGTNKSMYLRVGNYSGFGSWERIAKNSDITTQLNNNDRNFITDTRGTIRPPSFYDDRYAQWDFQHGNDTLASGDPWQSVLTVAKWAEFNAAHRQEQLLFTGDDLKRRTATSDDNWGEVKTIWDSGNLNIADYATQAWVSVNFSNQTLLTDVEGLGGQTLTLSNGNAVTITNNFVTSPDGTRNPNDVKPNTSGNRVRFDFANASSVKGSGNYAGVMTYSPWDGTTASTGDSSYQLAFANQTGINGSGLPMLKIRKGIDDNWSNSWYKIWSEGDFSKTDINNWNNIANTATTQSWVESQDYATHSFVEESFNKITSEHIDPDYSISARSNLNTIILTDQFPVQFLELESELTPGKQMTIINTASFDIEVRKDGNIIDIVRSAETNEYYITRQQRLVRKGFYRNAKILS